MAHVNELPEGARRIHMVGVCGTGMGTVAGMLQRAGYQVSGSDENVYPPMSDQLEAWGIPVMKGYSPDNLDRVPGGPPDLVVIGNVCRRTNPECVEVEARGLPFVSMPEIIRMAFIRDRHGVVVAGTHGKSTTTALLGHLMAPLDPGVLVGALVRDFGGPFRDGAGDYFVIEGDEYDTAYFDKGPKFLHYAPRSAILTNVEFDHGDIFPDDGAVDRAFASFLELIPEDGLLLVCRDEARAMGLARDHARCRVVTYGLAAAADYHPIRVRHEPGGTRFDLVARSGLVAEGVWSPLSGEHNLKNAVGAMAMAMELGLPVQGLVERLKGFQGLKKRQEVVGEASGVLVIDDFAHHPTAVRETIRAMAERYPGRPIWAVFEAKSNTSRMNIFQEDYARAFDHAAHVVIARPYEKKDSIPPHKRLDIGKLVRDLAARSMDAYLVPEVDDIVQLLVERAEPGELVLGMSGSSFGGFHQKLLRALERREATR